MSFWKSAIGKGYFLQFLSKKDWVLPVQNDEVRTIDKMVKDGKRCIFCCLQQKRLFPGAEKFAKIFVQFSI